jgi:hypothetical protein
MKGEFRCLGTAAGRGAWRLPLEARGAREIVHPSACQGYRERVVRTEPRPKPLGLGFRRCFGADVEITVTVHLVQVVGKRAPYAAPSCPGVEWRATVDEDGQYCFAAEARIGRDRHFIGNSNLSQSRAPQERHCPLDEPAAAAPTERASNGCSGGSRAAGNATTAALSQRSRRRCDEPFRGGNMGSNPVGNATVRQGAMQRRRVLISALSIAFPRPASVASIDGRRHYSADRFARFYFRCSK